VCAGQVAALCEPCLLRFEFLVIGNTYGVVQSAPLGGFDQAVLSVWLCYWEPAVTACALVGASQDGLVGYLLVVCYGSVASVGLQALVVHSSCGPCAVSHSWAMKRSAGGRPSQRAAAGGGFASAQHTSCQLQQLAASCCVVLLAVADGCHQWLKVL
jgi:hypothetical protein